MMRGNVWKGVAVAALLALPALAAEDATEVDASEYLERTNDDVRVSISGGAGTFLGNVGEVLGPGAVWGIDAGGDVTEGLGWEVGYDGSRNPFEDDRVADGSALWRHGVDAMAKVYAPGMKTWRPFAGAGLGASYLNIGEGAEGLYRNDFIAEVPLAAGLELAGNSGLNAGVRATYRWMIGEEFAEPAITGSAEGGLLSGQLTVGGQF